MKTCTFLSEEAVAFAFSHAAFSQTQAKTMPAGEILAKMQPKLADKCEAARQALATAKPDDLGNMTMRRDISCCMPAATQAAFPPGMRATQFGMMRFIARMNGAAEVCTARSLRATMDTECAKGNDPLAQKGSVSTPALATARCTCLRSGLSKVADADIVAEANASAARFDAAVKANGGQEPEKPLPVGAFMPPLMQSCR